MPPQQNPYTQPANLREAQQITATGIVGAIVLAAILIAGGAWLWNEVQTGLFINDCKKQGGVAKVWTISGQKFCDIP